MSMCSSVRGIVSGDARDDGFHLVTQMAAGSGVERERESTPRRHSASDALGRAPRVRGRDDRPSDDEVVRAGGERFARRTACVAGRPSSRRAPRMPGVTMVNAVAERARG